MDMPKDSDGPVNLTEGERNPGELEHDEVPAFQAQDDAFILDEILRNPLYGGFPVHIVSTEEKRILDPPCKVCGNLDAANFTDQYMGKPGSRTLGIGYWKRLEEGPGSGCLSCTLIRATCQPYQENDPYCRLWYYPQDTSTSGLTITIYDAWKTVELEICAIEGTICPLPLAFHRPLTWNSIIACRQISQWLDECSSDHDCYDVSSFPVLPTRLLEIQGPQQVRIYLSGANERASYACLSHCWGGVVPLRLLQATLRDFQQEVPWDRLPRTFKDAIEVAKGLDLRFLWIDSLCIVQDDAHDWRRESAMMASVYSRAHVTLAASQAAYSTQGLFPDPKLARYKKVYIGFNGQGKRHEIFVRHGPQRVDGTDLPLLQRAWYFQENMLSPRTVHFTEGSPYLACHHGVTRADQNEFYPTSHDGSCMMKTGLLEGADPITWNRIVSAYSRLSLTYPKDVFPALQGIAKKVQAARQCDYFAGIWGDNVMVDLLWYRSDEATKLNPPQYLAPTWSWASQPGSVFWDVTVSYRGKTYLDSNFQPDAVCISISTTPVADDPLGEVTSGELQLQGCCLSELLLQNKDSPGMRRIVLKDISFGEIHWQPDVDPCQLPDKNVTIIYMGTAMSSPVLLVLIRMSMEREEYRRVGIIGSSASPRKAADLHDICKDKGERKIVTIV
jgi:hypothetical protein